MSYNWECAYRNGFHVSAEGLDIFRLGAVTTGGRVITARQFALCENNFGSIDVWETKP
jgi:hypothetical protein